jgi:hypothetical protein
MIDDNPITEDQFWIQQFYDRFMAIIYELPFYSTLSFSGGIESSAIFFGLIENGTPPYECVTFEVGGKETKDTFYAKKICKYYDVPLVVVDIPIQSKEELVEQCKVIIDIIKIARNIDVQCCHAYLHILDRIDTKNLITGFYEDIHYEANKKLFMMYRKMKKGEVDQNYFETYYRLGKESIFHGLTRAGTIHNYVIIENFLNHFGIKLYCPFKDQDLFDITQALTFEDTNFFNGKFKKKWFITQVMFKNYFDRFGNHKNSNYMHTQGMKQYHRKVLLDGTPHKDTVAVYNRIKSGEIGSRKKNTAPTLF